MAPAVPKGTTNYAEIQKNEVEVLQSIYMEDFEQLETKPAAWNVGSSCLFPCLHLCYERVGLPQYASSAC